VNTHQGPSQNQATADRQRARVPARHRVKPDQVKVPPYYPDTPGVRQQLANVYNNIAFTDQITNGMLKRLADDGLADDTVIFLYGDHGDGIPRVKCHLFHESLRVPLIVKIPEKFRRDGQPAPGSAVGELVSLMDLGPTVMSLAGIEPPAEMDGRAFLGEYAGPEPRFLFGHRDRVNSAYNFLRSACDRRWHYIRNFRPDLAPTPPVRGHVNAPAYVDARRLHGKGNFSGPAAAWLDDHGEPEQLYDTETDPHCVNNLASDPKHRAKLEEMRKALYDWQIRKHDLAFLPESLMIRRASEAGYPARLYARSDAGFIRMHDLALAWQDGEAGRKRLEKSLDAKDPAYRYWAVLALGFFESLPKPTLKRLEERLNDDEGSVARAATWSLHRLGKTDETTLAPLSKVLRKGNYAERLEAIQIARRIGLAAASLARELRRLADMKVGSYYDGYLPSAAGFALEAIYPETPTDDR
jgi:uncharacterized sulfatase